MSSTKKIVLNVLGVVLSLLGGAILLFGLFNVMMGLAWSNGSARDLFLVFLFALYAVPAGLALLGLGIFLQQSANNEAYVQPQVRSQRQLGLCLLLPAIAALFLLMVGYPNYRFWAFDTSLGILLVLLAAALLVLGSYLIANAHGRARA